MHDPLKNKLVVGGIAVLVVFLASAAGIHYSSQTEFCLSCHEMRIYQNEQKLSAHAKDALGREIGCSQCHIPSGNVIRMLGAKAWMGLLDLWVHTTEPGVPLDRAMMQTVARRFTDDANCRNCHRDLMRNAKNDGPVSAEGQLAHLNYEGKNGRSRSGCVGCHGNLAHLPPFDARIPANKNFAMKLKENRS